ncbi:MAG: pyridoxal phosphate-dependent aminotransferase [Planctomycetia bacterium]|nr:pyridoxal phosphate-dependent aminotransferase [Planctomycetia bacterium]
MLPDASAGSIRRVPSSRLPWSSPKNAFTLLLEERRRAGAPLLDLTLSNPTKAGIAYPGAAILDALRDERALQYEPDPRGTAEAREAIAAAHGVGPADVLVTASTSEAYALIFKMLCDPGDSVLVPQPSYPLFDHLAALEGVAVEPYALDIDAGWRAVLPARTGAQAVVAVSPNNPTGSFFSPADVDAAGRLGVPLVVDEVFAGYPFGAAPPPARARRDLDVFTLGGLSKSAGLPQLKLGWILATGPGAAASLDRLAAVADAYLSVSAPVMRAAPKLLALAPAIRDAVARRTRANLAALRAAAGARLREPAGGWYAVVEAPARLSDEDWALRLLRDDAVVVHPGYFFNFPREAFLVVSLLPPEAEFAEAARRLTRALDA